MSNERFEITDLSVCIVCVHLIANGEYDDGTDAADVCGEGQQRIWGDDAAHMALGDNDFGFSWSPCEGCGESLAGDRFYAVVMVPR
jgi:hypothetical protein